MSNLTLQALLKDKAQSRYNDPEFMTFIDDYVPRMRNSSTTSIVGVEPAQALKYQGDLFGLFTQVQIPFFMHFAVMKLNGFDSPIQYQKELISQLLVPDEGQFKKLFNLWRAHNATRK